MSLFIDGADFEDVFDTPAGPVQVMAECHIVGRHLVLDELLVFPRHENLTRAGRLNVGASGIFAIVRSLRARAASEGFDEFTVVYHRIGKGREKRIIVRNRRLR